MALDVDLMGVLRPENLVEVDDVLVTSPRRTAYDLARRGTLEQRVAAVDAVANAHGFEPGEPLRLAAEHRGTRGNRDVPKVLALADRRAGSPMETRLRLVIVLGGLPRPDHRAAPPRPDPRFSTCSTRLWRVARAPCSCSDARWRR